MLNLLLETKKITKQQYDTYSLFVNNEMGYNFLRNLQDFLADEIPHKLTGTECAWLEGRKSVVRGLKFDIEHVKHLLEQEITKQAEERRNDNNTGAERRWDGWDEATPSPG